MQVKILFDKIAINNNLHTGWGISYSIDNRILFDTGENGKFLIDNMKQFGLSIDSLESIAISHDHWDHTGGLWEVLKRKTFKVYGCKNFSSEFKKRVEDFGSKLYNFYRYKLDFGGSSKIKNNDIKVSVRKFKHAKELIDKYGRYNVSEAMSIFIGKLDKGLLYKRSPAYFEKILENNFHGDVVNDDMNSIPYGVPIKKSKVSNVFEKLDQLKYNWLFTCPKCGLEVDAWKNKCPDCKIIFIWSDVEFDNEDKEKC